LHSESYRLRCLRYDTGSECGNGTILNEVPTFHSVPRLIAVLGAAGTLEFAFGLQPIIKLIAREPATFKDRFHKRGA
jgi:hypothetical protein